MVVAWEVEEVEGDSNFGLQEEDLAMLGLELEEEMLLGFLSFWH